jgi:hypothetical protein
MLEFADKHGLIVAPFKDLTAWERKLQENGGKCLCDGKRVCPCNEAIDEVKANGTCFCLLYVNQEYLDEMEKRAKEAVPLANVINTATQEYIFKTPKLQEMHDVMIGARDLIGSGDLQNANALLENQLARTDCSICTAYLTELVHRVQIISDLMLVDIAAGEEEKQVAMMRAETVADFAKQADMLDPSDEQPSEQEQKTQTNRPRDRKNESPGRTEFHNCMRAVLKSEDMPQNLDKRTKFCISTKTCGKDKIPINQAIRECVK